MPNHVTNILTFDGDQKDIDSLLDFIQRDRINEEDEEYGRGTIDFEKIIPMPKSLHIESGSRTTDGLALAIHFSNPNTEKIEGVRKLSNSTLSTAIKLANKWGWIKYSPTLTEEEITKMTSRHPLEELLKIGKVALKNLLNYEAPTWYEWSVKNWGTKWNSYNNYHLGNAISFCTAWSAPHPIIETLSRKFPTVSITHKWADENIGSNCGTHHYENGMCVDGFTNNNLTLEEASDFADGVWGYFD